MREEEEGKGSHVRFGGYKGMVGAQDRRRGQGLASGHGVGSRLGFGSGTGGTKLRQGKERGRRLRRDEGVLLCANLGLRIPRGTRAPSVGTVQSEKLPESKVTRPQDHLVSTHDCRRVTPLFILL